MTASDAFHAQLKAGEKFTTLDDVAATLRARLAVADLGLVVLNEYEVARIVNAIALKDAPKS